MNTQHLYQFPNRKRLTENTTGNTIMEWYKMTGIACKPVCVSVEIFDSKCGNHGEETGTL